MQQHIDNLLAINADLVSKCISEGNTADATIVDCKVTHNIMTEDTNQIMDVSLFSILTNRSILPFIVEWFNIKDYLSLSAVNQSFNC